MPFVDHGTLARITASARQAVATVTGAAQNAASTVAEAAHQAQSEIMREDGFAARSFASVAEVGGSAFALGYCNGKLGSQGNKFDPAGGQAWSLAGAPVDGLTAVLGLAAVHFAPRTLGDKIEDVTMIAGGAFGSFCARLGASQGAKAAQTSGRLPQHEVSGLVGRAGAQAAGALGVRR
jgi:hypothetical protein